MRERRKDDESRWWDACVTDFRVFMDSRGIERIRLAFRIDGHEDAGEAIAVYRVCGPLGLGVGLCSAMLALAPDVLRAMQDADEFEPSAEDFVGKRASVTVYCKTDPERHMHFVTSVLPTQARSGRTRLTQEGAGQ